MREPEENELAYQVETYDSRWNEIRSDSGSLLYWANKYTKQIYRVDASYVSGPINLFLGDNVTGQFKEEEIEDFCRNKSPNSPLKRGRWEKAHSDLARKLRRPASIKSSGQEVKKVPRGLP